MASAQAIVLDASAVLQVVTPDSEAARQRAERLVLDITAGSVAAFVLMLFLNEIAAACARAVRGRRIDRQTAEAFFAALGEAPISLQIEIITPSDWFERARG